MSEKPDSTGSDGNVTASDTTAEHSLNGTEKATAVAVADSPVEEAETTADATSDATVGEAGAIADGDKAAAVPTADATDDSTAAADDASPSAVGTADALPADDGAGFLAELARAMQATAGEERQRAAADITRRRDSHLASIEARRAAEADRMRKLADGDLRAIDSWADGERQRIDREREARAAAVREDLTTSLTQHAALIDREIEAVEAAIFTHRSEIDAFFTGLDRETDPVAIAQHASRRPAFPTLESITVSSDSVEEAAPGPEASAVPVMDQQQPEPKLADAWASWNRSTTPEVDTATESTDEAAAPEAAAEPESEAEADAAVGPEPTAVAVGTSSGAKDDRVLQSVPVSRPMSWLRRPLNGEHTDK